MKKRKKSSRERKLPLKKLPEELPRLRDVPLELLEELLEKQRNSLKPKKPLKQLREPLKRLLRPKDYLRPSQLKNLSFLSPSQLPHVNHLKVIKRRL